MVAEGVETEAQLDVLVALGCDRAQGHLFATPGPPGAIEDRVLRDAPVSCGKARRLAAPRTVVREREVR